MIVDLQLNIDGLRISDCTDIDKFVEEVEKLADTSYGITCQVMSIE